MITGMIVTNEGGVSYLQSFIQFLFSFQGMLEKTE